MDTIHVVRHKVLVERLSQRYVAEQFGITAQGIAAGCNNGTLGGFTGTLTVVTRSGED
jgi:hypothetical protein